MFNCKTWWRYIIRILIPAVLPPVMLVSLLALSGCGEGEGYTRKVWNANSDIRRKILELPFIRQVADGTLDEAVFREYVIQDFLFLEDFRRAYEVLLRKAPDGEARGFITGILEGIDREIADVHEAYFGKYGVGEPELARSVPDKATEAYGSYLVETATSEPFEVGLIATLPCHWIYYDVGTRLEEAQTVPGNPYQDWIDEYGTEPWESSDTKRFVDFVERYMAGAPAGTRAAMEKAFRKAAEFELEFWDAVYRDSQGESSGVYPAGGAEDFPQVA